MIIMIRTTTTGAIIETTSASANEGVPSVSSAGITTSPSPPMNQNRATARITTPAAPIPITFGFFRIEPPDPAVATTGLSPLKAISDNESEFLSDENFSPIELISPVTVSVKLVSS